VSDGLLVFLLYLLTIATLLITLTIHEFGHFIFAIIFHVNVREFCIGIGPKLFSKKSKKGLKITIRLLPIMAYVILDTQEVRRIYQTEKFDKNYE